METWTIILCAVAGAVALGLYFVPSYLALKNNHPAKIWIILLNLFFGYTIVGWIAALLWSTSGKTVREK